MANMASVAYAIEGPEDSLEKIAEAIIEAVHSDDNRYEMYQAAEYLELPIEEDTRLGGEIESDPELENGVLRFWSEERWGLQDFAELLEKKFPDIKVYWIVEESGCEVYCTNDREGKYFPERYWVDTAIDDIYNSEYFETEKQVYDWLDKLTFGRVKCEEDVEKFNADYENSEDAGENFIYIHEFDVE
jgi:hypothetical protein